MVIFKVSIFKFLRNLAKDTCNFPLCKIRLVVNTKL